MVLVSSENTESSKVNACVSDKYQESHRPKFRRGETTNVSQVLTTSGVKLYTGCNFASRNAE